MKAAIRPKMIRVRRDGTLLFIVACALCYIFANGQWGIPILTWIYPFLFLSLLRKSQSVRPVLIIFMIYNIGFFIQWTDVLNMGPWICLAIAITVSGIKTFPYIAYQKFRRSEDCFAATILFPAAMVTAEYVIYLIHPILAGLSDVYTQYQNLTLINLSSLFGVYGIIFVMYWTSAVAIWLREHREGQKSKKAIIIYAIAMGFVFMYGIAMLNLPITKSNTVRIASITVPVKELLENDDDVYKVFYSNSFSAENLATTKKKLSQVHDELFKKTIEEAKAGAKIIFWSELNGAVMQEDEARLITHAAEIAKQQNIYLVISLLTKTPYEKYKDNKVVAFNPQGEILSEFFKTVRSPGELCVEGTGKMQDFPSEFGRLTSFICSDMASSDLVNQAGRDNVDIIMVPASDWKEMSPIAIKTAIVRGIENGCSVVRQTNMGISIAADYSGRILSRSDYYTSESMNMVSEIPIRGRFTVYPYVGNILPWGCTVYVVLSLLNFHNIRRAYQYI
jgi:apolipoprotein N-acyltransferase